MKYLSFLLVFLSINLNAQVNEITLIVEVPNKQDQVYITGNQASLGNWDPAAVVMKKISAKKRKISLPVTYPVEFKFTKGSWDSEGYISDKWNTENVRINNPVKKAKFKVRGWYDEDKIPFNEDYIRENAGRYSIEIPEVQELAQLIFALTAIGIEDKNLINHEGEYYQNLMQEFDIYRNDPLVLNMNNLLEKGMYTILKMDACGFYFEGDKIKKDSFYNKLSWSGPNSLEQYIPEIENFGKKINFRAFYKNNTPYYDRLIEQMDQQSSIKEQWEWLENNFDLKYDHYRITFSPLVNGSHSTNNFVQPDFRQTVMFIRGPIDAPEYSEEIRKAIMQCIIFTEIDHNYVNPVSDMYAKEIRSAMPNLSHWATPDALQYYHNEYMVFNEYVTWAVYSLYAREKFSNDDFIELTGYIENMMEEKRGFIKFREFNQRLLELYTNRKSGQIIPDLYPEIIKYFKTSILI